MKLFLLFIASAAVCLCHIDATTLPKLQDNADDIIDRQLRDYLESKDNTVASIAAADTYLRVSDGYKLRRAQKRLAAAQAGLAAVEYFRAPADRREISRSAIDAAHAATAEYFRVPIVPRPAKVLRAVAEGLAAAAEYYRAPEITKLSSKTDVEASYAAAAAYFNPPSESSSFRRTERVRYRHRS